ncbi:hypothetical protein C2G38_2154498 [Gigaspora rosea]|uniref:BTB domain-containing protein n=1 Tax=Gigaspora rosea TaxID=44941 RepID=A0A397W4X5_9GLOM|nr:hypothetical protein C2G38_2154498 [Gigaspora rosea]
MLIFYNKVLQDFTQLLESEYNYDTIIEIGEQPDTQLFKVHSAILYQRSSYFQQKLANTIKGNNIFNIKLPNISVKTFNIVISKYIYSGVVSLENLETGQSKFQALQQFCNEIIIKCPDLVFDSDDFTNLQENALISLLEHNELQLDESVIWDKVLLNSISIPFSIINLGHAVEISSWINRCLTTYDITEIPYEFKLLLRDSRDGFDVKTFHKLYDNIPDLIVVIKVENSDEILGGYYPLGWKFTNSGFIKALGSFIFSLKNENKKESILSRVNDKSDAICYNQYNGPWFYYFGHYDANGLKEWYYNSHGDSYN